MIVPDVNLLLYAFVSGFPEHERAREWWEESINGPSRVGLTHVSLFGFVRIVTNARLLGNPLPVSDAVAYVDDWLAQPSVTLLTPGPTHVRTSIALLSDVGTAGNLTTDAQLAAYALENRGVVHTNDADFAKFSNVKWVNPLRKTAG